MDSEPNAPEAEPDAGASQPTARKTPAARKPAAPRKPATPRKKPAAAAPVTGPAGDADEAGSTVAAESAAESAAEAAIEVVGEDAPESTSPVKKPAARKPAAPRTTTARTTTPRTTTPRTTTPRSSTARSTTPRSTTAAGAGAAGTGAAAKRPPAKKSPAKVAPAAIVAPIEVSPSDPEVTSVPADAVTEQTTEAPLEQVIAESTGPVVELTVETTDAPDVAEVSETTEVAEAAEVSEIAEAAEAAEVAEVVEEDGAPEAVEAIEPVAIVETPAESALPAARETALRITGLVKRFGDKTAVAGIDLEIAAGSFFGIVGPNGAGKTTTLSMATGLLKPDAGSVTVHEVDVWSDPARAKRKMGVLPDRLRLFDRLTGAQLLYYSGILRGLDKATVRLRTRDLAAAFGLEESLNRLVTDYSAGMTKKLALAAAMIHSPRVLVLDEPFEAVDPVSAANVIEILQKYVAAGGTVVLSSHTMNLIERVCDSVAIIVNGSVLASGSMDEVRSGGTLEERFVELAGGRKSAEGMEWLHTFSD